MRKRAYSDEFKAWVVELIKLHRGDWDAIDATIAAQQEYPWQDVPRRTLQDWGAGKGLTSVGANVHARKTGQLIDSLRALCEVLVEDAFDEHKRRKSSLKDTVTSAAILVDKIQILSGQPTEIHQQHVYDMSWPEYAGDGSPL